MASPPFFIKRKRDMLDFRGNFQDIFEAKLLPILFIKINGEYSQIYITGNIC